MINFSNDSIPVYSKVAKRLNSIENHRTDFEFENALIGKTFVFQFINSYIALFFIAFIKVPSPFHQLKQSVD